MTSKAPVERHRLVRAARAAAAPARPTGAEAPEVVRTRELVDRLRAQWTRSGADIATRLRPGVDDSHLDAVERQLGLLLPRAARTWWREVNGVDPVRTRYRTSSPTVGPGGWVPLDLGEALPRASGQGLGLPAPPALLPMFARV